VTSVGATRTYLELLAGVPPQAERELPDDAQVLREYSKDPELFRSLYRDVGAQYRWIDRLPWTDEEWRAHVSRPEIEMYLLTVAGERAGYFELHFSADGQSVEIAYFGLLPAFVGRGLGSALLTSAIRVGRSRGELRVWLHTCTFDHPHALANYQARGFRAFRTEAI
jgi:ribosomal protein S18 acetylase RimI-like enzyme